MNCYHPAEAWSRETITTVQTMRLKHSLQAALASPFYGKRFSSLGITPEAITSPASIRELPFTTKNDLRSGYPFDFIAVPKENLVRLHASSGTTGSPITICHTRADLNAWADLMARCMYMVGIRKSDTFQNIAGYGLFTGGLGIHAGAERLGCLTIPAGAGNTRRQIKLIQDMQVSALHIIPSYALYLGGVVRDMGLDPSELPPRIALIGAEPHTEEARRRIERLLGLKAYNSYGLSEMNGPGVAFECLEQNGMHVWEDAYIPEIINPQTLEPVADGEVGELVLTTLCRQGMPILRYRTSDLTRIIPEPCPCGRVHRRIERIMGRADDMLIIKGCNFYPMQVEQILLSFPEVGQNYLILLEQEGDMDQVCVQVEIREEYFVEDVRTLTRLQKRIAHRLRDEILFTPKVELVQANTLPQQEGKAVRVLDRRNKGQ